MSTVPRTQWLLLHGATLILVVSMFVALNSEIQDLKWRLSVRPGVAHAVGQSDDTEELRACIDEGLERTTRLLNDTRQEISMLRESGLGWRGASSRLEHRIETQQTRFEDKLRRLEGEAHVAKSAWKTAASNLSRLDELAGRLEPNVPSMKERMIYPTVQLRGNGTVGSGVIVYSVAQPGPDDSVRRRERDTKATNTKEAIEYTTLILTAYHVVSEVTGDELDRGFVDEVQVLRNPETEDYVSLRARIVLLNRSMDLALLCLDSKEAYPYCVKPIATAKFAALDTFCDAYAVGCPLGNRPMPTLGQISSTKKRVGEQVFWMLNAPTFFGNSGGGVYDAVSLKLIGISSMIYTYGKRHPTVVPHMGLFVPMVDITKWLKTSGYGFALTGKPVPARLRWKLVKREEAKDGAAAPSAAKVDGSVRAKPAR